MAISTIRPADPTEVAGLGRLLARAFHIDPVTRWLVPDRARHEAVIGEFFEILISDALKDGAVEVFTDDADTPLAVAVWVDHTDPETLAPDDAEPDFRFAAVFGPHTPRWRVLDQIMATGPGHPHQYLMAIGAHPDVQGYGFGSRLLRAHHQRTSPAPAYYLQATNPDSRQLFLRHGYTDHGAAHQLPAGPPLWPMMRPPSPPARSPSA